MKKIFLLSAFFFVVLLFTGCLTTLHPIFTEKDLVYKPELIGNWKTSMDNDKDGSAEIQSLAKESTIDLPGKISTIKGKGLANTSTLIIIPFP